MINTWEHLEPKIMKTNPDKNLVPRNLVSALSKANALPTEDEGVFLIGNNTNDYIVIRVTERGPGWLCIALYQSRSGDISNPNISIQVSRKSSAWEFEGAIVVIIKNLEARLLAQRYDIRKGWAEDTWNSHKVDLDKVTHED